MFTAAVRLEIEKKVRERSRDNDGADGSGGLIDPRLASSSPVFGYAKSDRYLLAEPVFRLDELDRVVSTPPR